MVDTQTNTTNEPEVVCNHKPGDVWADGCCTSKKNEQTVTETDSAADTSTDTSSQTVDSTKD